MAVQSNISGVVIWELSSIGGFETSSCAQFYVGKKKMLPLRCKTFPRVVSDGGLEVLCAHLFFFFHAGSSLWRRCACCACWRQVWLCSCLLTLGETRFGHRLEVLQIVFFKLLSSMEQSLTGLFLFLPPPHHSQKAGWGRKWEVCDFSSSFSWQVELSAVLQWQMCFSCCVAGVWCSRASSVCLSCATTSLKPGSVPQFSPPACSSTSKKTPERWRWHANSEIHVWFTQFISCLSGMNHHTSWLHSETGSSEWLNPCVLLLCQFCVLTCGVFSGLAMVGRCVTGLVLSYSAGEVHTCARVCARFFSKISMAVKKKPQTLLSASVKAAWAVKPDLRGPSSRGRHSEVINRQDEVHREGWRGAKLEAQEVTLLPS